MTYTTFRNTEDILLHIDDLESDGKGLNEQQIAKKFGWEDDYFAGKLSTWQQTKPKVCERAQRAFDD